MQLVSASTKLRQMFYRQIERRSFHTAWVKSDAPAMSALLPLYPSKATFIVRFGMSVLCQ